MFHVRKPQTGLGNALNLLRIIFHATVRNVRKSQRTPIMSLIMNMMQTLMFVLVFLIMFQVLGMRGTALRGDFVIYVMSGIFLYMVHTQAVAAVSGADGPTSPMMQHAPMNTVVAISSAALSSLYTQVFSMFVILFVYYVAFTPFEIYDPIATMAMVLLAWLSGCAIGLVVMAAKPWSPGFVTVISTIYQRANMIASGKMFVANMMPSSKLVLFDWNPLFHVIDQARGFAFVNYNPHHSDPYYAAEVAVAFLLIGLVGEYYTRKRASSSWTARG